MSRTIGAVSVPTRKKARIIAKKKSGLFATSEIAVQENISERTVQRIVVEPISVEVKRMADEYELHFITYNKANAYKAQQQAFNTINELNAKDATIVAEKNFNMIQAANNAPTTKSSGSPNDNAIALIPQIFRTLPHLTPGMVLDAILRVVEGADEKVIEAEVIRYVSERETRER